MSRRYRNMGNQHKDNSFNEDNWKLPYSTMILVLMIFFMILYTLIHGGDRLQFEKSMLMMSQELGGRRSTAAVESSMLRIKELEFMKALLEHEELRRVTDITVDAREIHLSFAGPVLFNVGQARLRNEARDILDMLGPLLADVPNRIIIEGHTCDLPIMSGPFRNNWELSTARAVSVKDYLGANYDIVEPRFALAGYGEFQPITPNVSPDGRMENRRIAFRIRRIS